MKKLLICFLVFILIFPGCGTEKNNENKTSVYYLSSSGKEMYLTPVEIEESDSALWAEKAAEILNSGQGVPADGISLFEGGVKINDLSFKGSILTVDLSPAYESQDTARKLLIRAGITRMMTQNKDISAVIITVGGKAIYDSAGNEIGAMTARMYVDENTDDINNYRSTMMTLYFTDETGSTLIPETREVYYSINTPVEQAVVNELIQGPSTMNLVRTLPQDANVLNVTIQDDICYVNFDESFLNNILNTSPEVQIYSIVNSIFKACQVEKVAFSVNGSNQVTLKDEISLDTVFSPDMDLVKEEK